MTSLTLSEARARLSEVLDRVAAGEEVEITRYGRPAARVVGARLARPARTDELYAAADRVRAELDAARRRQLSAPAPIDVVARLRELRADRESR